MNQAEHLWKMLDDMAASDPEAYKRFVEQNIKNGAEEMKKEKQTKIEEMSIVPQLGYSMKIMGNLMKFADTDAKLSLKQNELKQETYQIERLEKRVKFYINVLSSDRVLGAMDKNDKFTDDPRQYNLIPLSVQEVKVGKSTSFGTVVYFYDVVINSDVLGKVSLYNYEKINRKILQSIIIDTVQKRIELDRNPLHFIFYRAYYRFEIPSLQIIKKQYKYCGAKGPIKLLLESQADKLGKKSVVEPSIIDQKVVEIPPQQPKQPLIQEIENDKIIEMPYQMTHEKDKIIIVINTQVNSFQDIDLSISDQGLRMSTSLGQNLELAFGCSVDSDNPSAKWDKKKKQLRIVVNKLL